MPSENEQVREKRYLDKAGLAYFSRKLNNYPTNDVIEAVINGVQDEFEEQQALIDQKLDASEKGVADGVATLDTNGKVPASQLPDNTGITYTITQEEDQHQFTLTGSNGYTNTITIPDDDTTYEFDSSYNASTNKGATVATVNNAINALNGGDIGSPGTGKTITSLSQANGQISASFGDINITKSQVSDFPTLGTAAAKNVTDNTSSTAVTSTDSNLITARTLYYAGYTKNEGTITGIVMNGENKGSSGVVDLGTIVTSHQDISGKADKTDTVSDVSYSEKTIKKTVNGTTSNVVSVATIKTDLALIKDDVGLENVDNTSDMDKPVSTAVQTELDKKVNKSSVGQANGVASLDANGKVPSGQLPSYVDDVVEATNLTSLPSTGETGKIYITLDNNKTYRWGGTAYVEISASLALGETSSTAYAGDKGKVAYDHAAAKGSAFSSGLYKITTNAEGHVTNATAVQKADITALGIPGTDTNTHRPIQVNGTQILGDNTTVLNLKAGANVTLSDSNGTVTINSTDTTYTGSNGVTVSGTNITNSGVRSISTGSANGTISVNTNGTAADVAVKGLGSAAYTASTAYVASAQGTDNAGRFLIVNSSGNVEAIAMSVWQGGEY